jgi:hypothetical protein
MTTRRRQRHSPEQIVRKLRDADRCANNLNPPEIRFVLRNTSLRIARSFCRHREDQVSIPRIRRRSLLAVGQALESQHRKSIVKVSAE